jgi:diphthamide biosynthesis protein 3
MAEQHHSHYEEVPMAEFTISDDGALLQHPCPCGDLFEMALGEFLRGATVAQCPTCSLTVLLVATPEERREFLRKNGRADLADQVV